MHEGELSILQRRQAVATYVETMSSVIPREASLSPVIEAAIANNILDPEANIDDQQIISWYAAIFPSNDEAKPADDQPTEQQR